MTRGLARGGGGTVSYHPRPVTTLPTALLSFDVEEFDSPNEHGAGWPIAKQLEQGAIGWSRTLALLESLEISATFFTTAAIANFSPQLLRKSAANHEIASHGFNHATLDAGDLAASRRALQALSHQEVLGFRRAKMQPTDATELLAAGYQYDSSIHPVWLPGRYNNRSLPRTIHRRSTLIEVPASATPALRLPLFWLAFKHYPQGLYRRCVQQCLQQDGYVNLYFHPWEFIDLSQNKLPKYMRTPCGEELCDRMSAFVEWLRPLANITTFTHFLTAKGMLSR